MLDSASESVIAALSLEKDKARVSSHGAIAANGRVIWADKIEWDMVRDKISPPDSTRPLEYIHNLPNQIITMQGRLTPEDITAMMDEIARTYANELLVIFDPKKVRAYQRLQAKARKLDRKRKLRKRQRRARQRRHNRGLS